MPGFWISVRMDRSVSCDGYCLSRSTSTSANVADFVTICFTCFSKYLVLRHCKSRSHLTLPIARVLADHPREPAKTLSKLAEVLPHELRQVHDNLRGGNSIGLP